MEQQDNDFHSELKKQIASLKDKLEKQEALLDGVSEWQGSHLYTEVQQLDKKRKDKQEQYKQLMKDRFRFVGNNWLQKSGQNYLQEKLDKGVISLTREIENIIDSRSSKSSLSSNSMFDNVESMQWLLNNKSEKQIKEQQKIVVQIQELQKILENIK